MMKCPKCKEGELIEGYFNDEVECSALRGNYSGTIKTEVKE